MQPLGCFNDGEFVDFWRNGRRLEVKWKLRRPSAAATCCVVSWLAPLKTIDRELALVIHCRQTDCCLLAEQFSRLRPQWDDYFLPFFLSCTIISARSSGENETSIRALAVRPSWLFSPTPLRVLLDDDRLVTRALAQHTAASADISHAFTFLLLLLLLSFFFANLLVRRMMMMPSYIHSVEYEQQQQVNKRQTERSQVV